MITQGLPVGILGLGAAAPYDPAMMVYSGSGYYSRVASWSRTGSYTVMMRFKIPSQASDKMLMQHAKTYINIRFVVKGSATGVPNKLEVLGQDVSGALNIRHISKTAIADNQHHIAFLSYNSAAGTSVFYVDSVDADDISWPSRVLTISTLQTTGSHAIGVGADQGGNAKLTGEVGFFGMSNSYLTNPLDFMSGAYPKQIDESGWSEWGAQPVDWNTFGEMTDNKGSGGNMTKNGTITGPS